MSDFAANYMQRINRAINHVAFFPDDWRPDFIGWLRENTHIYLKFEDMALNVARFRKHYSGYTLFEVIRHETAIGQISGEFKLDNNMCADCCRLFMQLNPAHQGFFELRARRSLVNGDLPNRRVA
jgi:hypothetical protein